SVPSSTLLRSDQLRVKPFAVYLIVSVITVTDTVDQQCRRPLGDSPVWLLRGGQVRPGLPGERAVLKADDRQLVRYIYALDPSGKQGACGNLVVTGKHRAGLAGGRQELAGALNTGFKGVFAPQDQFFIHRQLVVFQCRFITLKPFDTGFVGLIPAQKGDGLVAEVDQ